MSLPDKSYLIYAKPEALSFLKRIEGNLTIVEKEDCIIIPCADIVESAFLKLLIPHDFPLNKKDYDFELLLPYHFVLFACSAQKKDLNKILGFRNNQAIQDKKS